MQGWQRNLITGFGWLLYVMAMLLPVNGPPQGSLNPSGPDPGFLGTAISLTSLYSIFFEKEFWTRKGELLNHLVWFAWGICNLTALFTPLLMIKYLGKIRWLQYTVIMLSIMACPIGLNFYDSFSIHYGYGVMIAGYLFIGFGQILVLYNARKPCLENNT